MGYELHMDQNDPQSPTKTTQTTTVNPIYVYLLPKQCKGLPDKHVTAGIIWNGFREHTTSHGIPQISRSNGFCKRLTWIAVSLCCLVGLIVNAYIIINDYASYQTEPALAYGPSRRLGFPAVTLCNLNAIKKSLLSREGALENVTETEPDSDSSTLGNGASPQTRKRRGVEKRGVGNGRGLGNGNSRGPGRGLGHGRGRGRNDDDDEPTPTEYENLTTPTFQPPDDDMVAHIGYRRKDKHKPGFNVSDSTDSPTNKTMKDAKKKRKQKKKTKDKIKPRLGRKEARFRLQEEVTRKLANIPTARKVSIGHKKSDFLVKCTYNGRECFINDFSSFYSSQYGNCYTFNSGWNKSLPLMTATKPGPQYGFRILLNIEQSDYIGSLSPAAGVRILMHHQHDMPFPEDKGFHVGPGLASSVGIKQLLIKRLGGKYGVCQDVSQTKRDVFSEHYPVGYTTDACMKTCYQKYVIRECGCGDPGIPMKGHTLSSLLDSTEACGTLSEDEEECMDDIKWKWQQNELTCDCPLSCNETLFPSSMSSVVWPADNAKAMIEAALARHSPELARLIRNNSDGVEAYRKSLVALDVYYEDMNAETISQKPSYDIGQFLSDLGGCIGLWIGWSLITMFEVMELLSDLSVFTLSGIKRKGK